MTDDLTTASGFPPRCRKLPRGKRLAFALLTLFSVAAVVVATGELSLWAFTHRSFSIFRDGRYLPGFHAVVHNAESRRGVDVRINAAGFRGPEWTVEPPPGRMRVAFVGDSFVAAMAVEESQTFVELATSALSRNLGARVEGLNFGVSGRDAADYLLHYRAFVRRYKPDVVVCCFFVGNDLRGRVPELVNAAIPDGDSPEYRHFRTPDTTGVNGWLLQHSRLYNWYTAGLRDVRDLLREVAARRSPAALQKTMRERFVRRWEDYRVFLDPPDEEGERCWRVIETHLAALKRDVEADGAQFLLVSIPCAEQVDDGIWQALCKEAERTNGSGWRRQYPDERLAAIAARQNIRFAPLFEPLHAAGKNGGLYFGRSHLTVPGHEIAAASLENALRPLVESRSAMAGEERGGSKPH